MVYHAAWDDPEQTQYTIVDVKEEDNGYEMKRDDGWLLFIEKGAVVPTKGDTLTCWCSGIGYPVRGVAINDVVVRYETAQQEAARHGAEIHDILNGLRLWVHRDDEYVAVAISHTPRRGPSPPFQRLSFTADQWATFIATPVAKE